MRRDGQTVRVSRVDLGWIPLGWGSEGEASPNERQNQQAEEIDSKALGGLRRGKLVRVIHTIRDGSERRGSAGCRKTVRVELRRP